MSGVKGNRKQEEKIAHMAEVVRKHVPSANILSVKGAFRFGISKALEQNSFGDWQEVAAQPPAMRRKFFASVLESAAPHLKKIGIEEARLERINQDLKRENEAFMQRMGQGPVQ